MIISFRVLLLFVQDMRDPPPPPPQRKDKEFK